ncbi:isopeptide-forming domain-containing fimbrial protein [Candidatus Enterococcus clewellii]|uniref:Gram-positive cocci surface proteins LPxTG domain-containing protein n=1 Tax=Candidatus Enterococcus clewellii TaxID=1834193 RepID=A0A242K911_9ENTE|nr:isopeptide-forming domain-containing fimbrial protein [Enterococcus sp. 9E7_DIV0242]OTP17446.1 hypothetical protein A5888_001584 [Enterococcus sp. 9E7_DIV0242]
MRSKKYKLLKTVLGVSLSLLVFLSGEKANAEIVTVDRENPISATNNLIIDKDVTVSKADVKATGDATIEYFTDSADVEPINVFQKGYGATKITFGNVTGTEKVTVKQSSIGTYKGKKISSVIEYSNFKRDDTGERPFLILSDHLFSGYWYDHVIQMDISVKFFDEQNNQVSFNKDAFISFNSLNKGEFASYLNQSADLNTYITNDSNVIEGNNPFNSSEKVMIGASNDFEDVLGSQTFKKNTASFQISGNELNFRVGIDSEISTVWNSLSSATLFNTEPEAPKKDVALSVGGASVNGKEVFAGQTLIYPVEFKVHTLGVDLLEKYSKLQVVDKLSEYVTYEKMWLPEDSSAAANYDKDSHKVTLTTSKNFRESVIKYNAESYTAYVQVKVNANATSANVIKNTASLVVNSTTKDSNTVSNLVKDTVLPAPVKFVLDETGKNINEQSVMPSSILYYKKNQQVNTLNKDILTKYSKFVISDPLPEYVNYISATLLKNDVEIKGVKGIVYDEKTHTVTFTADAAFLKEMEMNNETYSLKTKAQVKANVKNGTVIKNVAGTTINDTEQKTNEVETPVKEPVFVAPSKRVLNENLEDINEKSVEAGDIIYYDIDQQVNTLNVDIATKYTQFSISDPFPAQTKYLSSTVLKNGVEMKDVKVISYDEKTHTVVFEADSVFLKEMEMNNETYTLRNKMQVIEAIGDKEPIKNTASSSINSNKKNTNEVENTTKLPKGSIKINKITRQLVDIDILTGELIYEKLPQEGVSYQVNANQDIVLPNNEIVAEAGSDYGTATTDKTGQATVNDLYGGQYVLVEQSAPLGIQIDPTPIVVDLAAGEDGKLAATAEQEDLLQEVQFIVNKAFENESGDFESGSGAVFGIFHSQEHVINADTLISADTLMGSVEIKDGKGTYQDVLIPNQTYYLQETSTIEGYQLNTTKYYFTYKPDSNEAVHVVEFYENGYVENDVIKEYEVPTEETDQEDVETKEKDSVESEDSELEIELTPIKNLLIHEDSITKFINENGELLNHYDILEDGKTIEFKGQIYIGDHEKIESIVFSDVLPDGFEFQSMKVLDINGNDVTKQVDYAVNEQKIEVTVKEDYASTLNRSSLDWFVETVYNYDESHKGKTFENQMLLTVNDVEKPSNMVTLTPPVIEVVIESTEEPTKESNEPVEKPSGMFPQTGETVKKLTTIIGLCLVVGVVGGMVLLKKKQAQEEQEENSETENKE